MSIVWHIAISGFRQGEDRPNGLLDLWLRHLRLFQARDVFAAYRPWNHDWQGMARLIELSAAATPKRDVLIGIYAYSYGAGWGAIRLCEHLAALGLSVQQCVLSDPVHRYALPLANWRALRWFADGAQVKVPPNVRAVDWLYQDHDPLIRGHRVVAADPQRTTVSAGFHVPATLHNAMDNHPEFHRRCLRVARWLTNHTLKDQAPQL